MELASFLNGSFSRNTHSPQMNNQMKKVPALRSFDVGKRPMIDTNSPMNTSNNGSTSSPTSPRGEKKKPHRASCSILMTQCVRTQTFQD